MANKYGLTQKVLDDTIYSYNNIQFDNYIKLSKITVNDFLSSKDCVDLCCLFTIYVDGATSIYQPIVIDLDKTGEWCYYLAEDAIDPNLTLLQQAIVEKDNTGEWLWLFSDLVDDRNKEFLRKLALERGYIHRMQGE